jgi:hypothetical protein
MLNKTKDRLKTRVTIKSMAENRSYNGRGKILLMTKVEILIHSGGEVCQEKNKKIICLQ